jgi:hypothetical protein
VEVKRMFTLPHYRGKGIAIVILNELENGLWNWLRKMHSEDRVKDDLKLLHFTQEAGIKAFLIMDNISEWIKVFALKKMK